MDRERPGNAETEKHKDFKNAHLKDHSGLKVVGAFVIGSDKVHCLVSRDFFQAIDNTKIRDDWVQRFVYIS